MNSFAVKLQILSENLADKKRYLEQILGITENQNVLLQSPDPGAEVKYFFDEMIKEKQALIDKVLNADTVFQTVFSEISPEFDKLAGANRAAVLDLQKAIEEVMELDVRIRGMEQKNKALTEPVKQRRSGAPKSGKNHVLNLYKENSRKKEKQNREDATLPKR